MISKLSTAFIWSPISGATSNSMGGLPGNQIIDYAGAILVLVANSDAQEVNFRDLAIFECDSQKFS